MKSKKVIHVKTNMFDLKIFWNGALVASQVAIFIGLLLLRVFSTTDGIKKLSVVILLLDSVAVLFFLLNKAEISIEEHETEQESAPNKETLDVNVEKKSKPKQETKQVPKRSKSSTINNKVPVPNPPKQSDGFAPVPEPTLDKTQPQPVASSKSTEEQSSKEPGFSKDLDSMTAEEWSELFKI